MIKNDKKSVSDTTKCEVCFHFPISSISDLSKTQRASMGQIYTVYVVCGSLFWYEMSDIKYNWIHPGVLET